MTSFAGKRCLVTGATDPKSIGYVCAEGLIQGGAGNVMIMGRDADKVASAVESLKNAPSKSLFKVFPPLSLLA